MAPNLQPVTEELVLELKAKYSEKRLRRLKIKTAEGDILEFIIRKPTRSVIEAVGNCKGDATAANKILIANCVLAGDGDALENDGDVYGDVMKGVGSLMKTQQSTLEKL
jgi:hypothetical protein